MLLICLAGQASAAEPIQLRMSWWGGNEVHKAQLETLRRFEARHPQIKVKAEYTGWVGHLERITTQIAGGTAPDVMQINWNWLVLFSRDGLGFYDLNRLSDTLDLTQFDADTLAPGIIDGRLNALPPAMAARLLYLNKTTWDKAGLPLPTSWDALLAAGPVFRDRLGADYYPLDLPFQDVVALTRAWIVQDTGLPLVDVTHKRLNASVAQLTAAAQLYQRMVADHVIPAARERASYGHVAPHEMRPWISGRYGGTYQWISAIGKSADTLEPGQQLVLAPHPLKPGARDAGLLYRPAMMLAINKDTAHPREAALLLDFLLNDPEAVRLMGVRRGVPVSATARATLAADGVLTGLAWDGLQQLTTLPHGVRESGWFEHARVRDTFVDLIEQLGYGVIDAPTAGQRLHDDVNRVLARTIR